VIHKKVPFIPYLSAEGSHYQHAMPTAIIKSRLIAITLPSGQITLIFAELHCLADNIVLSKR